MTTIGELFDKVQEIDDIVAGLRNRSTPDNVIIADLLEEYRNIIVRTKVNL